MKKTYNYIRFLNNNSDNKTFDIIIQNKLIIKKQQLLQNNFIEGIRNNNEKIEYINNSQPFYNHINEITKEIQKNPSEIEHEFVYFEVNKLLKMQVKEYIKLNENERRLIPLEYIKNINILNNYVTQISNNCNNEATIYIQSIPNMKNKIIEHNKDFKYLDENNLKIKAINTHIIQTEIDLQYKYYQPYTTKKYTLYNKNNYKLNNTKIKNTENIKIDENNVIIENIPIDKLKNGEIQYISSIRYKINNESFNFHKKKNEIEETLMSERDKYIYEIAHNLKTSVAGIKIPEDIINTDPLKLFEIQENVEKKMKILKKENPDLIENLTNIE